MCGHYMAKKVKTNYSWQYAALCLFLELFWAHPVLTLRGGPCGVGPKKFRAGPCLVEPPVDPRGTCTFFVFIFLNILNKVL